MTRARVAIFIFFSLLGIVTGSYLSRLPTIREDLSLSLAEAGMMLLCQSVASLALVPLAGSIVQRIGTRRAVTISAYVFALAFVLIGVAPTVGSVPLFGLALACMGVAFGLGNVPLNIASAAVERGMGRSVMSQFHASYSLGCVAGAGLGALTSALAVPVLWQFVTTGLITLAIRLYAVRLLLSDDDPLVGIGQARREQLAQRDRRLADRADVRARRHELRNAEKLANESRSLPHRLRATVTPVRVERPVRQRSTASVLSAWTEPRTLLLGVVLVAAAMSEGSANDWLPIGIVETFGETEAIGALCFGLFLTAMTTVRLLGTRFIDRFGRVRVLRMSAGAALVGLVVFALSPHISVAVAGILIWGLGAALVVPICISAASDDPVRAAARVSVTSSFSSAAGLAVPPMFGFVAEHIGVQHTLGLIALPMLGSLLLAGVVGDSRRRGKGATVPAEVAHADAADVESAHADAADAESGHPESVQLQTEPIEVTPIEAAQANIVPVDHVDLPAGVPACAGNLSEGSPTFANVPPAFDNRDQPAESATPVRSGAECDQDQC